jgi:DnaA family protein
MQQLPLGVRLPDHATFNTFHAGRNERTLAHLRRVAAGDSPVTGVFVSGPTATGKTHLLQATCAASAAAGRQAGYLSSSRVLEGGGDERVLDGWQSLALVCIDEVDRLCGHRAWETQLMRLYNHLAAAGGTLLLAAREPVAALPWRLEDLRSRLAAGLLLALQTLDDEEASLALQLRASARGIGLPPETAAWLLRRFRRDLHSQCALLDGLDEASLIEQRRLTVPFVRKLVQERGDPSLAGGDLT